MSVISSIYCLCPPVKTTFPNIQNMHENGVNHDDSLNPDDHDDHDTPANHDDPDNPANQDDSVNHADKSLALYYAKLLCTNLDLLFLFIQILSARAYNYQF